MLVDKTCYYLKAFNKRILYNLSPLRACFAALKQLVRSVELSDLWPNTHCGFSLTYSRCYHLCHTLHPYNQYVSLCGQVLCVQTHWPGNAAYSGLFVWLCKCLWTGERMNTGIAGLLEDTCVVFSSLFLVLQGAVTLCTCELTFNPVTSDSVCTYTQQKLCPNLMHVFVLVCCYVKCLKHPTALISERPAFVQNTIWCINLMMWEINEPEFKSFNTNEWWRQFLYYSQVRRELCFQFHHSGIFMCNNTFILSLRVAPV